MALHAFYDVTLIRDGRKPMRIATVKAVRCPGPSGNWFAGMNGGAGEIMTPDLSATHAAMPAAYRRAFMRTFGSANGPWSMTPGHTQSTLHASSTLFGARHRVLGTLRFEGYEKEI